MSWDEWNDCPTRKGKCPSCGRSFELMADEHFYCEWCGFAFEEDELEE